MVFVFKCDGTEDVYLVDAKTYNTGNAILLEAGDVISGVSSPSDMYYHGMPPTRTYPATLTPSAPQAGTSTSIPKIALTIRPTDAPYPEPGASTPQPKSMALSHIHHH